MTISTDDPRWSLHTNADSRRKWGDSVAQDLSRVASESGIESLQALTRAVRGLSHLASEMQQEDAAEALSCAGHVLYGTWGKEARFPTLPRDFYVPQEVRNKPPIQPEGTDLYIWKYEAPKDGKTLYYAIVFQGKSNKPLWNYSFQSEPARDAQIKDTVDQRKKVLEAVEQRRKEKREFKHGFEKRDILYASWGYDQTNVDFYEVTDVGDKSITIREVASRVVGQTHGSEKVMADPGNYVGPPMKKIPQMGYRNQPYVKIDNVRTAYEWEGDPLYQTASGWGH